MHIYYPSGTFLRSRNSSKPSLAHATRNILIYTSRKMRSMDDNHTSCGGQTVEWIALHLRMRFHHSFLRIKLNYFWTQKSLWRRSNLCNLSKVVLLSFICFLGIIAFFNQCHISLNVAPYATIWMRRRRKYVSGGKSGAKVVSSTTTDRHQTPSSNH